MHARWTNASGHTSCGWGIKTCCSNSERCSQEIHPSLDQPQHVSTFLGRASLRFDIITAQCTLVQMRGIGIACRPSVSPSVHPSVTLVTCDHIGWKSWKLIARTISLTPSLFVAKRRPPTPRGTEGNLGETRGGVGENWHAGEQKRQYLWNA